jgi:lysophospholipase L1-like esterase
MLVLGDSTAVGVGAARPEESLAGLIANKESFGHVENYAMSGAVVADIAGQITKAKRSKYDFILIQIGGNDIIRFRSAASQAALLAVSLEKLPSASQTLLLTAGNVGGTTLFPLPMRPFYERLTLQYHEAFAEVAREKGIIYVNLYVPPAQDPFVQDPDIYLAKDGLHPSSAGYQRWFEQIQKQL